MGGGKGDECGLMVCGEKGKRNGEWTMVDGLLVRKGMKGLRMSFVKEGEEREWDRYD